MTTSGDKKRDFGRNSAAATGFEYTFFTLFETNADLGLILEYQYDDRSGVRQQVAQNDLALGARWAFNDIDGSEILAIFNQDLDYSNRFFSLEVSRRLTDNWKLEAEALFFADIEQGTPEFSVREDDHIRMELRRYF